MNWGYKLMLVFIAFGSFMGYMVYSCMKTPVSLVSAQYYNDELNYQEVIDGTARANALAAQTEVTIQDRYIALQLPGEMQQQQPEGKVLFYCVSDGKKDRQLALDTDGSGRQLFALDMFSSGRYIVKIDWKVAGNNYYSEKEIIIQQ